MDTLFNFSVGVPIAFSSPLTLMANPTVFIHSEENIPDIELIQPRLLIAVPLMIDRIRSKVNELLNSMGIPGSVDKPLPPQVRAGILHKLGGKLERVLCGGASFPESQHRFASVVLGLDVFGVYASTESVGLGASTVLRDGKYGYVGLPHGALIRLEDWEEGGYRATDFPSKGEILISGPIAYGYFKNDKETEENFVTDSQGRRWWRSGDIGSIDSDGYIKIIDRKKDLVKPSRGEYISPAAIEAELKSSPLVSNICVCGRNDRDFVVALVLPERHTLFKLSESLQINHDTSFEDVCRNNRVVAAVRAQFLELMKDSRLSSIEKPRRVKLCTEDWTPESGLVTAAFKIRRRQLHDFYKKDLFEMFNHEVIENDKNGFSVDHNGNSS
jgi:long-chain acyl-CoA synthetase